MQWLRIALLSVLGTTAGAAEPSYYLIGNSLTWDTVPPRLAGDVQWHVDCGVSLPHICTHPEKPCVKESTLWPKALRDKQYTFVSVQPHYGSTLVQDVATISHWMAMQPEATFVVHSGWARHADREHEFASYATADAMTHSPGYLRALLAELRRKHPGRNLRPTLAQNFLAQIAQDIAAKRAPWENVASLYRDEIHLTHEAGKYLAHNAMRRALGQPRSAVGFEKIPENERNYLDSVLALADTSVADKELLRRLLASEDVDRQALIAEVSDRELQRKLTELLPSFATAIETRRAGLRLEAEVKEIGGKMVWAPSGPQWLYLATGDEGTEIFDVPVAIDLYNGNNPLKGQGGRNERVNDAWLERLSAVKTLKKLDLANCAIRGEGLKHIAGLTNLRELNLTLTPLTDDGLQHLAGLTELRVLGLASTQCTGTGFTYLTALEKLENVNFHFTPLNDAGLRAIAKVPISNRLWFAHTKFTDAGAAALVAQTKLKRCGIGGTDPASSGEAVAALVKAPLEELALLDRQATPAGVAHAAKIETLKKLDLSHAPTVGDESLPLLAKLPQLEELKLGAAVCTDDGLQSLAAAKSLKKLFLSGMSKLTPAGVERLRQARPDFMVELK